MADKDTAAPDQGSALSLLSLSIAAASAAPIPVSSAEPAGDGAPGSLGSGAPGYGAQPPLSGAALSASAGHIQKHRRLSSTGKARRRLSDARDAATRPSPALLQSAASALSSLATLSLSSSSVPPQGFAQTSVPFTVSPNTIAIPSTDRVPPPASISSSVPLDSEIRHDSPSPGEFGVTAAPIAIDGSGGKSGKKRGTVFTCESCSKVYRHPSCLIKHRWEHSPHWREASKFVLSKHQQVQLLEAAAILSHLSPSSTGTSLPEDRSLWPSFLSGGVIPTPSSANAVANGINSMGHHTGSPSVYLTQPLSSSMPATATRATSAGPRLHDYSIPPFVNGAGGITQLRPGLLGVPTGSHSGSPPPGGAISPSGLDNHGSTPQPSLPVAVPTGTKSHTEEFHNYRQSDPWGSPASLYQASQSYTRSDGWSLPRSSLRSVSGSSRSRSGSKSDDEESELVDVDIDVDVNVGGETQRYGFTSRGRMSSARYGLKREEDEMSVGFSMREEDEEDDAVKESQEWDGMEMEMEMD